MHLIARAALALSAAALVFTAGCAKGNDSSQNATTTVTGATPSGSPSAAAAAAATTSGTVGMTAATGDVAHGKTLFMSQTTNCTSCHGASGREGGVGPSLANEKSRKTLAQTIAQIKNPAPPMPKLYPSPLSDKDVSDVAAFVQTL